MTVDAAAAVVLPPTQARPPIRLYKVKYTQSVTNPPQSRLQMHLPDLSIANPHRTQDLGGTKRDPVGSPCVCVSGMMDMGWVSFGYIPFICAVPPSARPFLLSFFEETLSTPLHLMSERAQRGGKEDPPSF